MTGSLLPLNYFTARLDLSTSFREPRWNLSTSFRRYSIRVVTHPHNVHSCILMESRGSITHFEIFWKSWHRLGVGFKLRINQWIRSLANLCCLDYGHLVWSVRVHEMFVQWPIASGREHLPLVKSRVSDRQDVHDMECLFGDANMMVSKGKVVWQTIVFLSLYWWLCEATKNSAPGLHTCHRNPQIKQSLPR